jgi:tetratricopeptide (TPR) repeat protein
LEPIGAVTPAEPEAQGGRRNRKPAVAAVTVTVLALGAFGLFRHEPYVRHVPTPAAHEAYTKGRYFLDQRSIQGWRNALENFERAIALDPDDPASHAGLADTYSAMSDFGVASSAEMRPRAMSAARRALELDSRSAEGHEALGRAQFLFDWDFAAAERSLDRALELDPEYMPAHQAMAWLKSALGRHAEAMAAAKTALQLDPVNTARYTELAGVFALAGRYDEGLRELDRALQLNLRSFESHLMKGWLYELSGKPDSAFATYRAGLRMANVPDAMLSALDSAYRANGLTGFYRSWLARRGGGAPMSHTFQAQVYVRAGLPDSALASLERAYEKREGALAWINVEPTYRPLRSDARFQRIAAGVTGRE